MTLKENSSNFVLTRTRAGRACGVDDRATLDHRDGVGDVVAERREKQVHHDIESAQETGHGRSARAHCARDGRRDLRPPCVF